MTFEDLVVRLHDEFQDALDEIEAEREARDRGRFLTVNEVDISIPVDILSDADDLDITPGKGDGTLSVSFRPGVVGIESIAGATPESPHDDTADEKTMKRVEGIGDERASQLRGGGINSLAALAGADPEQIARMVNVSKNRAAAFIRAADILLLGADPQTAELLAVRGIDADRLTTMTADELLTETEAALDERIAEVPQDYAPDIRALSNLINRARKRSDAASSD